MGRMNAVDPATCDDREPTPPRWGLGLDVGGSTSRWAWVRPGGEVVGQGELPGLSGLLLHSPEGVGLWAQALSMLDRAMGACAVPADSRSLTTVWAGVTGLSEDSAAAVALRQSIAAHVKVPAARVHLRSDVGLAFQVLLAPGRGVLLYAGTGSIAVHVDREGGLHRAGGRGVVLDDAGGGHWIAREALRLIWRAEDGSPGAWAHSRLARCVFEQLGGPSWAVTREQVYGPARGELGRLALAVARAARSEGQEPGDRQALALLGRAGRELARLAGQLLQRLGPQPVALSGRVFDLHPAIERAARRPLEAWLAERAATQSIPTPPITRDRAPVHVLAARRAAAGDAQSG